jgi:hypothetical protein
MATHVYDAPAGTVAHFYIDGEYVRLFNGGHAVHWMKDGLWYDAPHGATARFCVENSNVYALPKTDSPTYILRDE